VDVFQFNQLSKIRQFSSKTGKNAAQPELNWLLANYNASFALQLANSLPPQKELHKKAAFGKCSGENPKAENRKPKKIRRPKSPGAGSRAEF